MKTKIIYISGSEIFDMADIRAAFEEVRGALGLDSDTVLFGVPVDNDNALGATDGAHAQPEPAVDMDVDDAPVMEMVTPEIVPEPVIDIDPVPEIEPEKPKKKSRGRPAKATKAADVTPDAEVVTAVADAPAVDVESEPVTVADAPANVSSILSVLTSKPVVEPEPVVTDITDDAPVIDVADTTEPVDVVAETVTENVVAEPTVVDAEPVITETDTVQVATTDITDDAPEEPIEKTLEQLLESMTPLREDHIDEDVVQSADDEFDMSPAPVDTPDATPSDTDDDDTDATLAQLATEFAENQDKIPTPKKTEARGKIGKLKNILPFKKAKRDDTGLMGDLFGWAGIAANDDDFAMPGFFTGVASKK